MRHSAANSVIHLSGCVNGAISMPFPARPTDPGRPGRRLPALGSFRPPRGLLVRGPGRSQRPEPGGCIGPDLGKLQRAGPGAAAGRLEGARRAGLRADGGRTWARPEFQAADGPVN